MPRSTIVTIVIALLAAVMIAALGCASSAPASTPAAPAKPAAAAPAAPSTPAAPATPAAPSTPAAPAAPAKPLSFSATTYTDTKNGFTVQHPKDWIRQPDETLSGNYVYNAKSGYMPNYYVSIYPYVDDQKIQADADKLYKSLGGTDIVYGKWEDLSWGDIKATFTKTNWNYPGGYNLDTFSVWFPKDGKTYVETVTVNSDSITDTKVKEIFTTFKFTK